MEKHNLPDGVIIMRGLEIERIAEDYAKEQSDKLECEHPFKRLHWIGEVVFCNKCNKNVRK